MSADDLREGLLFGGSALFLLLLAVACWQANTAESRARRLLNALLTPEQRTQLATDGYLEISSPGAARRAYHIPRNLGRVRMYEDGRLVCELCLQPVTPLPPSDVVLLHKLLIEDDEEAYLATANHFAPGALGAWWAA